MNDGTGNTNTEDRARAPDEARKIAGRVTDEVFAMALKCPLCGGGDIHPDYAGFLQAHGLGTAPVHYGRIIRDQLRADVEYQAHLAQAVAEAKAKRTGAQRAAKERRNLEAQGLITRHRPYRPRRAA